MTEKTAAETAVEYVVKFNAAHEALRSEAARVRLVGNDQSLPIHMQAKALSIAEDLERQLSSLTTANERLRNIAADPTGPSVAVIKQAIGLAEHLAQLVAQDTLSAGKFAAVVGVVVAFSELAPPVAVPAAGAEVTSATLISAAAVRVKLALDGTAASWLARMQGQ